MDDQYAFGEMDEQGKASLAAFAAQSEHRSTVDLCPPRGGSTSPEKQLDFARSVITEGRAPRSPQEWGRVYRLWEVSTTIGRVDNSPWQSDR
jgi:hypothetical protein